MQKMRLFESMLDEEVSNYDTLPDSYKVLNKVHQDLSGKISELNKYADDS